MAGTHARSVTAATATKRVSRTSGNELAPRQVRRTRRLTVDLDYIREIMKGMGCTTAYVDYVMQHGGLPAEDRQNWPREYKTLDEVLAIPAVPANNVTPMAPAFAMDLEALTRLAQDVCEEAPAAAPVGPAAA